MKRNIMKTIIIASILFAGCCFQVVQADGEQATKPKNNEQSSESVVGSRQTDKVQETKKASIARKSGDINALQKESEKNQEKGKPDNADEEQLNVNSHGIKNNNIENGNVNKKFDMNPYQSTDIDVEGAIKSGFYILLALSASGVLFVLFKLYRMRLTRAERKYGVQGDRTTQELTPLPIAIEDINSDDDDHTLFELNRHQIRIL